MTKQIETLLILKYGSMYQAYHQWQLLSTSFSDSESDAVYEYAQINHYPTVNKEKSMWKLIPNK